MPVPVNLGDHAKLPVGSGKEVCLGRNATRGPKGRLIEWRHICRLCSRPHRHSELNCSVRVSKAVSVKVIQHGTLQVWKQVRNRLLIVPNMVASTVSQAVIGSAAFPSIECSVGVANYGGRAQDRKL